jgi:eukaryotic-like serine/threonine-protein kinase
VPTKADNSRSTSAADRRSGPPPSHISLDASVALPPTYVVEIPGSPPLHDPLDAEPNPATVLPRLKAALEGRYDVVRELGRGGMAAVFLAHDVKHDREVAVKVLHPELAASLGAERFEREIRLAAKLQHPHILGLHDSGVAGDLLYYVMPFVKGESLRDRIDREGMLPVDDAIAIALEVNDALGYAHSQGVIHRDIKPENILLTGGHALVADFGIARAVTEGGPQKLTQTGMSMGTPHYMSPEQASGETVGPTADLYSLGCVLYEMLAGEPPFTGKNAMQVMARHAMEQVPSIRIVRNVVPEEVEEAIFAALGKVPADRPQTAAQFAEIMGLTPGHTASMRARTTTTRRTPMGVPSRTQTMEVPAPAPIWWRRPLAIAGAIGIVVLLVGAVSMWRAPGRRAATTMSADARRIAVLYFDDKSDNHSLGPVADGLTEELIHSLSSVPSLTIISRSGVERYRGASAATDSIARALRAGYVVRGELEPEGDRVRVNVRLYDGSGVDLKRAAFAVAANNVSLMRDTLAVVASDLIRQQLGFEIQMGRQRSGAENSAAWLLLQRGEQAQKNGEAANAKGDTAGLNRQFIAADSLYAAAQSADDRWADPSWMRAALAYRRSRLVGVDPTMVRKWIEVGLPYADRAVSLDANSADAYEVRGNLRYWGWLAHIDLDPAKREAAFTTAQADLERATVLNRNQAGAWSTLSHLYNWAPGTTSNDVYMAAQHALEADEFLSNVNVILSRLFDAAYDLGQFDKAKQWCDVAKQRFPADVRAVRCRLYLLTSRLDQPDVARAWRLADSAVALAAPSVRSRERLTEDMLVAAVLARASKQQPSLADSARHVAKRSEGDATIDPTRELAYFGAFVYTLLGDKDQAINLLKQHLAVNPHKAAGLRDDPGWWFRDISTDRRFQQAVTAP